MRSGDGVSNDAARVEALSYELSPYSPSASTTPPAGPYTVGKDFEFHGWTARLGMNWKF